MSKWKKVFQRSTKQPKDGGAIGSELYNEAAGASKVMIVEPDIKGPYVADTPIGAGKLIKITGGGTYNLAMIGKNHSTARRYKKGNIVVKGTGTVAEITQVVADTLANTNDGEYFDINAQDGNLYRVYMDTTGGDVTQPATGGRILTKVDISGSATAILVGDAVAAVVNALADFSAPATGTGTILITDAVLGDVVDAANGNLTGIWAITTDTQGVSTGSSVYVCDIAESKTAVGTFDSEEWTKVALALISGIPNVAGDVVTTGRWHNAISVAGFVVEDESEISLARVQ